MGRHAGNSGEGIWEGGVPRSRARGGTERPCCTRMATDPTQTRDTAKALTCDRQEAEQVPIAVAQYAAGPQGGQLGGTLGANHRRVDHAEGGANQPDGQGGQEELEQGLDGGHLCKYVVHCLCVWAGSACV